MVNDRSQRKLLAIACGVIVYCLSLYYLVFVDMSPRSAFAQTTGNTNSAVYLPIISRQEQPTATSTPTSTPVPTPSPTPLLYPGTWTGFTTESRPITLTVSQDAGQVLNFMLEEKLEVTFKVCPVIVADETPVSITNNEFVGSYKKGGVAKFSFTGKFVSPTTANGTYTLYKWPSSCGWKSSQGTWTATVSQ